MAERLCLIGLDGVPLGLLERLAAVGVMPRMAERIGAGHLRAMRASLPEISSVSWSSFMTGTQPGEHGIFGFTDIDPQTYALTFPSFAQVTVPTIWDRLGKKGLVSVVLNQPATYPARRIPGALVSGFVAVDLSRSIQPLHHLGPLRRLDYRIDIDTLRSRGDHDWLFRDLHRTLESRRAALAHFWDFVVWDLMQVVVTGTDRLYHFLWDAVQDPKHPRHEQAIDYHRAVDRFVGEIFERFDREENGRGAERFWMLSDHGFCGIKQEVQINAWLRQQGYLVLPDDHAGGHEAIDSRTVAFALDPGRIYLHRADRFARGPVPDEKVPALKRELTNRLRELRYDGELIIRDVFDAAEIYQGDEASRGPDLVVLSHRGYDLKGSVATTTTFGRTDLVGMHTYDDAFLLAPRPLGGDLWIGDLAAHLIQEFDS